MLLVHDGCFIEALISVAPLLSFISLALLLHGSAGVGHVLLSKYWQYFMVVACGCVAEGAQGGLLMCLPRVPALCGFSFWHRVIFLRWILQKFQRGE